MVSKDGLLEKTTKDTAALGCAKVDVFDRADLSGFYSVTTAGVSEGDCRNAAQCESLGHRPRKQAISSRRALKGREEATRSFRPVGAWNIRFAFSQGVALGCHMVCLWHSTHGFRLKVPVPAFSEPERSLFQERVELVQQ